MSVENPRVCENHKYLWKLASAVVDDHLEKWPEDGPEDPTHPRHEEYMKDEGNYQAIGDVRRGCPKFVLGLAVEPGRATFDGAELSCVLTPGEVCPIQQETDNIRQQYTDLSPENK